MSMAARIFIIRARWATRRAARERRRRLMREMACYDTPAARDDLAAAFDRYPDGDTHEYRDILTRQRLASTSSGRAQRWQAMGRY